MQILQWLGKPVLVLLNQTGRPKPAAAEHEDVLRWRARLAAFSVVRQVLPLDAFARCWVHERVLLDAVGKVLPAAQTLAYQRVVATWQTRNEQRFEAAMQLLSGYLLAAARDVEPVSLERAGLVNKVLNQVGVARDRTQQAQQSAMDALAARLEAATVSLTQRLIALHGLEGSAATKVNERLAEHFAVQTPADPREAGFWGAVASGAATGLSADLLSGGLTVGGGMLIGGVVGALTAAGAAFGFNRIKGVHRPTVRFAEPFLQALVVTAVLRYLAVAHYGRGRGDWVEGESPGFWQAEAQAAVAERGAVFDRLWLQLRATTAANATVATTDASLPQTTSSLQKVLSDAVRQTLLRLYPDAVPASL